MRFVRIRIERFGPLRELSLGSSEAPLPGLVVLLGENEAGKTAFHGALSTLLFGFSPASRDLHPFVPWGGGDPALEGDLLLRGSEAPWTVHRALRATPRGRWSGEGHTEAIDNRPIPAVAHLQGSLYREVYALTGPQMARVEEKAWGAVQDQLVLGMGSEDLRPPAEARKLLLGEADQRWRPNRRGGSRTRALEEELDARRKARAAAEDRAHGARTSTARLAQLGGEIQELRQSRSRAQTQAAILRELLPLRRRLRRFDALARELGEPDRWRALPREPGAVQGELKRRELMLSSQGMELAAEEARLQEWIEAVTPTDTRIARASSRIRELDGQGGSWSESLRQSGRLEGELEEVAGELQALLLRRLPGWSGTPLDFAHSVQGGHLRALPISQLRDLAREADELRVRIEPLRDRLPKGGAESEDPPPPLPIATWGTGLLGTLALLGGILLLAQGRLTLGAVLLLPALLALGWGGRGAGRWMRERGRMDARHASRRGEVEALELQIGDLERQRTRLLTDLEQALSLLLGEGSREWTRHPREVVDDLGGAQTLVLRLDRIGRSLQASGDERSSLAKAIGALAVELELELPSDPLRAIAELMDRLRAALKSIERREEALIALKALTPRIERHREETRALAMEEEAFRMVCEGVGGTLSAEGVRELESRLPLLREWESLELDLTREGGELDALRRRIADFERTLDDPSGEDALLLASSDEALAQLSEEHDRLTKEESDLQARLALEEGSETVGSIDGEIAMIREEIEEHRRERDRFFLLERILSEAEARFRDRHQPDLLRRAEETLSYLTAGRYRRLLASTDDATNPIHLTAPHLPGAIRADGGLSTGTREQVYMSLRLAIVDHLDEGHDRPPLLLDETFMSWDPSRRGRILHLLGRRSEERQVFLLTCHPPVAEEVAHLGGLVLTLPSPEGEG